MCPALFCCSFLAVFAVCPCTANTLRFAHVPNVSVQLFYVRSVSKKILHVFGVSVLRSNFAVQGSCDADGESITTKCVTCSRVIFRKQRSCFPYIPLFRGLGGKGREGWALGTGEAGPQCIASPFGVFQRGLYLCL